MARTTASLPYHEPDIITILIQSSFLLVLNAVNHALDRLLYCGLIGQIFIGIAWGTPGGNWLPQAVEQAVVQLGYLGLILLVFEGGLSTSFRALKANLLLSVAVAVTGICLPVALSFALQGIVKATALQAFAAGAALCSTSLGTTFTILGTTGLTNTRLGVVLTSAAMLDDVVGLVMVQVISNLGSAGPGFNALTVVRPVLVSIAFASLCPVACRVFVVPITRLLNVYREAKPNGCVNKTLTNSQTLSVLHTIILIGMVVGTTYAGTSNLLAAYLAGAMISWWDAEVPHPLITQQRSRGKEKAPLENDGGMSGDRIFQQSQEAENVIVDERTELQRRPDISGVAMYEAYYSQPVGKILKPFFFASIGFSIPISQMFAGRIIWRGLIYALLMIIGKLICGVWLIRFGTFTVPQNRFQSTMRSLSSSVSHFWERTTRATQKASTPLDHEKPEQPKENKTEENSIENEDIPAVGSANSTQPVEGQSASTISSNPPKPSSLYPASILGLAMVARGEIGFLISSLADSNGIFDSREAENKDNDIFLIVTWAIGLCTFIGPVGVGFLVRRVKKLEREKEKNGGERDVLGVWGVG